MGHGQASGNGLAARASLRLFAAVFGSRRRFLLTTAEIERQLQLWQRDGLPFSEFAQKRRGDPQPLSAAYMRKIRQSIFQLYELLDRGAGEPNPVRAIPVGKEIELDARGHAVGEVAAVIRKLPAGSRTKARCAVMAYVGLRPDEVTHVQRRDWSPQTRSLYVRSAKGSERKRVPLTRRGAAAVRYFFYLGAEGSFTSAPLNRMIKTAAIAAGLEPDGWDAYSLRHSFGTWHYAAARDIKATKEPLRQKSIRMTERYMRGAVSDVLAHSIADLDAAIRMRRRPAPDPHLDPHAVQTGANPRQFSLVASNPERVRGERATAANLRKISKK